MSIQKNKTRSTRSKSKRNSKKLPLHKHLLRHLTQRGFTKPKLVPVLVAVIFAGIGSYFLVFSKAATSNDVVVVYRTYNPRIGDHFLATSQAERDSTVSAGYTNEGVAFYAWSATSTGRVTVNRLLNPNNGLHMYTADPDEQNSLVSAGWRLEGPAFYAAGASSSTVVPAYRLSNPSNGDHLFTANSNEKDSLVSNGSYRLDGIAFYVLNKPPPTNSYAPKGTVDTLDCNNITGWAFDPDTSNTSSPVHIYIDGQGYNTGPTSVSRPDVNAAYKISGNHGFNLSVDSKWRDSKTHTAAVYAIDLLSDGTVDNSKNALIKQAPFTCNSAGAATAPTSTPPAPAQTNTTPSSPAPANLAPCEPRAQLMVGSRGDCVKRLQQLLNAKINSGLAVDGIYGTSTKNAVIAYKATLPGKCDIDGANTGHPDYVGNCTWSALEGGSLSVINPDGSVRNAPQGSGSGGSNTGPAVDNEGRTARLYAYSLGANFLNGSVGSINPFIAPGIDKSIENRARALEALAATTAAPRTTRPTKLQPADIVSAQKKLINLFGGTKVSVCKKVIDETTAKYIISIPGNKNEIGPNVFEYVGQYSSYEIDEAISVSPDECRSTFGGKTDVIIRK